MTPSERITQLAQDIYLPRNGETYAVDGEDLLAFQTQTIMWVNQLIPEIEKKADWNFVRTNNDVIGTVTDTSVISHPLPVGVRKLIISPYRDLTVRQDGTPVSSFKLVNPNLIYDPSEGYDNRSRATVLKRKVIFSRTFTENELGGDIVADTIAVIPKLSMTNVLLLDLLDENPDIRQLFIYGVLKNQILPDIVQGGLAPSYAQKFDAYLSECIAENNQSADSADADRDNFAFVHGVGI